MSDTSVKLIPFPILVPWKFYDSPLAAEICGQLTDKLPEAFYVR